MALTTVSGVISGIRHSTETRGHIGKHGGNVQSGQVLAFRLDDRSAQIKLPNLPDIRDGDRITLAGTEKNGTFHALALRNDQTRAVNGTPYTAGFILGFLLILLGIPLSFILIGLPFLGFGIYTVYKAINYRKAALMLQV